jgi:hypothetical protein
MLFAEALIDPMSAVENVSTQQKYDAIMKLVMNLVRSASS